MVLFMNHIKIMCANARVYLRSRNFRKNLYNILSCLTKRGRNMSGIGLENKYSEILDSIGKLEIAIVRHSPKTVEHILTFPDANPLAVPRQSVFPELHKKKLSVLKTAIILGSRLVLESLLKGLPPSFDLSKPMMEEGNDDAMNWIQYGALHHTDSAEALIEYQLQKFPGTDISRILNRKFKFNMPDGKNGFQYKYTTIGTVLIWTIANTTLANNYQFMDCDETLSKYFVNSWYDCPAFNVLTARPPNNFRIGILPFNQLHVLLKYNYDTRLKDHAGDSLITLLHKFVNASKSPAMWEENIRPNIIWDGVEQTGPAQTYQGNRITFPIKMNNLLNAHPILAYNVPNYESLLIYVDPFYAQTLGLQSPMALKVQAQLREQECRIRNAEQELKNVQDNLSRLSEIQYNAANDALDDYLFYQAVFQRLQHTLESYIRQRSDAHLKVFQSIPANKKWRVANNVLASLHIASNFSPIPYVAIVPAFLSIVTNLGAELDNARKNQNVFDLQANPKALSTMLSVLLVNEAMSAYTANPLGVNATKLADALAKKVQKRLDNIGETQFDSNADCIAFLCFDALEHLRSVQGLPPIARSSPILTASSQSTRSGSSVPKPAHEEHLPAIMDSRVVNANTGNKCCVMM